MLELTVKASELRRGEYCIDGLGDFPAQCVITGVHQLPSGEVLVLFPTDEHTLTLAPDAPITILRPDPAPDPLTVLRGWVQAGHDACMAAGCSRLHPEFRSDNGGWVVVNTDDLLDKIAKLEQQ